MNAGALYLVGDALVRTTHTKVVLFCLVLFFVLLGNLRPLANYQWFSAWWWGEWLRLRLGLFWPICWVMILGWWTRHTMTIANSSDTKIQRDSRYGDKDDSHGKRKITKSNENFPELNFLAEN